MGNDPTVRLAVTVAGGRQPNAERALMAPPDTNPTVRLAHPPRQSGAQDALTPTVRRAVAVRQAYGNSPPERNGTSGLEPPRSPIVRLATAEGGIAYPGGACFKGFTEGDVADRPALLVSYVYLKPFLANRHRYHYRDWVMDSGAFSAHHSGTVIRLQDYIDTCKRLTAEDPTLTEVFALDVIGDWKASLKNCEAMWKQGVEAIPCYHVGEPESVLKGMAKDYPKIAIGGCVGYRGKDAFAAQCFARVWPKRIHGFGFGSEASVMALPWHSVDATNWEIGPCKFGRWNAYGKMSVRGSKQNLRAEVEWYLALERRARVRWAREMAKLDATAAPAVAGQTVRLACNGRGQGEMNGALMESAPAVRLVANAHAGRDEAKAHAQGVGLRHQPAASSQQPIVRLALAQSRAGRGDSATLL